MCDEDPRVSLGVCGESTRVSHVFKVRLGLDAVVGFKIFKNKF